LKARILLKADVSEDSEGSSESRIIQPAMILSAANTGDKSESTNFFKIVEAGD